uniref:Developmental pluripotency associated 4 n=1 Tax=Oryctolagus cuniculus TaxID=9986 RepID=G1SLK7_RABIT
MENSRGKERTATGWSREEQWALTQPSTSLPRTSEKEGSKRKRSMKDDKVACPKERGHTKGPKIDLYKRLCEYAYPHQKPCLRTIPNTAKEVKIKTSLQIKSKVGKEETSQESAKKTVCSAGTDPPEVAPPLQEGGPVLLEDVNTVEVTTSAPEAVLASWARIVAGAGKRKAVETRPEASGDRWCVVHGKSLPANTRGWVQLQLHAGQAWVPEKKKGRVSALFLLPASNSPPPYLEDNMLCPECVHRNKILSKSLQ